MPTALIVEDDPALRLLSRVNLELGGFEVVEAATVEAADAVLTTVVPDVVLLDMHLGRFPSTDLLGRLRSQGIPVAIVTGTADLADLEGTADAVLGKPFSPADLVDTARRLARVQP